MKKNIILVLLVVLFLSVGYSSFTAKLQIEGIAANVRINADIRITSISIDSFKSSAISSYEDYNVDNITSGVFLPNADSEITYKIEITNLGNTEMGIFSITGIPDNMEYSLTNYNLKEKICDDNNQCSLGIKKEILLTVKYKEGGFDSNNTSYNLKLDFDFNRFYGISYSGYDDTTNYPKEVLEGDTIEVNFGTEYVKYTKVYISGTQTNDFTNDNGIIKLENVTGDVNFNFSLPNGAYWVFLTYNNNTVKKIIDTTQETSTTFSSVQVSSGVVVRCNNGAVPTFTNNIVTPTNITTTTYCQVFDSLKESVESSDDTVNHLLQIRNENPTIGQINVASTKTIYYDINGKTINYVAGSDSVYIVNSGNLTISDKVGTGLLKTDYRLIQSYSNLTIDSGNYKRENSGSSIDGGVVQIFSGVANLKNSTFITDKTWSIFTSTNTGQIINIDNCTVSSQTTMSITNNSSNGIINILNSTITSSERTALYGIGGGPIYICKSSLNAGVNDFTSYGNGKMYYASDVTFKNQSNSPTVDNSDDAIKNNISNCAPDWYMVKAYDSSDNVSYAKYSDGTTIKVGDKVKLTSKVGDSSTYVMDVDGAVFESGRNVQIYENNNTNAQQYTFLASASAGYYNIVPYSYTSLYLNISGATSSDGANIMLYNGSDAENERFKLVKSTNSGYHYLRSFYGTNIDVDGGTAANYQNVQSWTPNATDAQNWKIEKIT